MVRHLYVHIPFCHRICPYCSFFKHKPGREDLGVFVDSLLAELRARSGEIPLDLETIYLGGGTPSLLSRQHLEKLLTGISTIAGGDSIREWTLEANPATFGATKARVMREGGVTRVSLGVQSLDPVTLDLLGRDHDAVSARESFETLKSCGFPVVNVDLMFSVPGQSAQTWLKTLEGVIQWKPDHVSAYNLTYEEDTPFFQQMKKGILLPDEDRDAEMFGAAIDLLGAAGLDQYEISNYARAGCESAHNRAYWRGMDYLAIGPGAVSTVQSRRWTNVEDTGRYIELTKAALPTQAMAHEELLSVEDFRLERLGLELRTREGIAAEHLKSAPEGVVDGLLERKHAEWISDERLRLTRSGRFYVDAIAAALA